MITRIACVKDLPQMYDIYGLYGCNFLKKLL